MSKILRFIVLLSLIVICLQARPLEPRFHPPSTIDLEHRLKLFNQVWEIIHDEHYDARFAGPEWKRVRDLYLPRVKATEDTEAFYQILRELAWAADSSHTAFLPTYDGHDGDIGVLLKRLDNRVVITKVISNSPAEKASLQVGDELVSAAGIPALSLHVNPVESELRGEEGSDVAVVVKQHDGQLVSHLIRREPVDFDIPIEWRLLDSGIGYIRIYNFSNQERINQFREAYSKLKDTPGLIIDVRGPNGGKPSVVGSILGYFIDRVEMMTFRDRQGRGFKSYTVPQKKLYQGKLAVVIDERSRSGQEIFANTLKEHARAIIIGTRSCGCVEGGNYVRLGENEELEIAHYAVVTPKHGKLEDTGVQPDHVVPITEKDIITGRDPQIRAAEQELLVESVN